MINYIISLHDFNFTIFSLFEGKLYVSLAVGSGSVATGLDWGYKGCRFSASPPAESLCCVLEQEAYPLLVQTYFIANYDTAMGWGHKFSQY